LGFFISTDDVTKAKEAGPKLEGYATDREFQAWTLEYSKQTAELATLAKFEFLANMSHEIRTPMNGAMSVFFANKHQFD